MKRVLISSLFAAVLIFMAANASAQFYYIGEEPSGVKWKKMTSPHFELIYPALRDDTFSGRGARNYLYLMELNYGNDADSIGMVSGFVKKFPVVLHPYNAESNAVTVWAPRQIDMFTMPDANISYPQRWDLQLVLHEGRHAWQIAHFTKGIYKYLYWFFGDPATGLGAGVYPSRWMLEGDAVVAETERSNAGRGRSGSFLAYYFLDTRVPDFRGTLRERTWDQWRFGSVKNYTPNRYALGYLINGMAIYKTKDYHLADKIFSYETRNFWNVNVIANAFETYTGQSHRDFINGEGLENFKKLNSPCGSYSNISVREYDSAAVHLPFSAARSGEIHGYYADYKHITAISPDSLLSVQGGYGSSPYLTLLCENGKGGAYKSRIIRDFSGSTSNLFYDAQRKKIWWSEIVSNPRWPMMTYSLVYSYDLKSKRTELLKPGTYWFNPSEYADYLAVTEYVPGEDCSYISVVNPSAPASIGGKMIYNGGYIFRKKFNGQILESASCGTDIYITAITDNGEGIFKTVAAHERWDTIISPQYQSIKRLRIRDGMIYFISDFSGSDKLYCCNLDGGELTAVTNADNISSYDICGGKRLFYTSLSSAKGFVPYKSDLYTSNSPGSNKYGFDRPFKYPVAEELTKGYKEEQDKEPMDRLQKDLNANEISVGTYDKFKHLFRPYFWMPLYCDVNSVTAGSYDSFINEAAPGLSLYSQNTLGTAVGMLGYSYLHGRSGAHAKFSYTGFYPVIELQADYNDKEMTDKSSHSIHAMATVYIPWQFNYGGWNRGITPQISWSYRNDQELYNRLFIKQNVKRQQIIASLGGYCVLPVAKAQIFPRLGVGFRLRGGFNPNGGNKFGSIYSAYLYGYVPGFLWNHGIKLSAGYQYQDIGNHTYWLGNLLTMPRGMDDEYGFKLIKMSADYAIPIYLGDVSLGCVAYLKRLQLIPFADYARIKKTNGWHNYHALGGDVILDGHIFRIGYPVSIGIRYANNGAGRNYAALLFSVSFN